MSPNLLTPNIPAPEFEIEDINGNLIRLADFRGSKPIVLAFLRGFL
jgi:peroxiredoxin